MGSANDWKSLPSVAKPLSVNVETFGTGKVEHLKTNLASILAPPLPSEDTAKLEELFGHLYGVGLDLPIKRTT